MNKRIAQKTDEGNRQSCQVKEEFSGKNLTRFGGSGLIRRFFKRHKIRKELDNRIEVAGRRTSKYSPGSMLTNCLFGIFLGYSRPSHMEVLATDRVFQKVADLGAFPVQSTISRFLKALRVRVAREIASFTFDLLMRFRDGFKALKSITLDLDSHVTPVFGNPQRAGLG